MTVLSGIAHMVGLEEQVITTDFAVSVKSSIQNYGVAITEVTSSDLREMLKRQLNDAISTHGVITNYMISKGYYHAYNIQEQRDEIMKVSGTALELSKSKK